MKTFAITEESKQLLKVLIEHAPQGGSMNIAQVRQAIKALDVIESATDSVTLEDADHAYVLQRFGEGSFIRADKQLIELYDAIANA